MNLCDRNEIQELLQRHGFRFSRSMGQNFLIDGLGAPGHRQPPPAPIDECRRAGDRPGHRPSDPCSCPGWPDKVAAVELDRVACCRFCEETLADCGQRHRHPR